jgi:hypothetical protein
MTCTNGKFLTCDDDGSFLLGYLSRTMDEKQGQKDHQKHNHDRSRIALATSTRCRFDFVDRTSYASAP